MQTAATTNHAALTASPRLSATIANETAPSTAIPVHRAFVCHPVVSVKMPIAFLPYCGRFFNGSFGQILAHRARSEHIPSDFQGGVSFAVAPRDWRAATGGLADRRRSARTPHRNKVRSSSIRPSPDGACREHSAWTRTDDLRW